MILFRQFYLNDLLWLFKKHSSSEEILATLKKGEKHPVDVLFWAIKYHADISVIEELCDYKSFFIDFREERDDKTPFLEAVLTSPANVMQKVLFRSLVKEEHDAILDQTYMGLSPILLTRDYDKIKILLECGANPNARSSDGVTAFMLAAGMADIETMKLLLSYGALYKEYTVLGKTAISFAQEALIADEKDKEKTVCWLKKIGTPEPDNSQTVSEAFKRSRELREAKEERERLKAIRFGKYQKNY